MYCSACNLEYSEQLKFCKQCGRALVQDVASSSTPLSCCTRCGARVVPNENFCQQCGARTKSRIEDTSIGACMRCGVNWRSAWLFCRHCGLDRDTALGFGAQVPPLEVVPTVTTMEAVNVAKLEREQSGGVLLTCPRCKAEITEYTQFCEICGQGLNGLIERRDTSRDTSRDVRPSVSQPDNTTHPADAEAHVTTLESLQAVSSRSPLSPQDEITKLEDADVTDLFFDLTERAVVSLE
jgi:rRNA maturation endonuclease Nob1